MPNIFFTDRPYKPGDMIQTKDYCESNRQALESLPPEHMEVENFLEEMRKDVVEELSLLALREAQGDLPRPNRMCSITLVPWPGFTKQIARGRGAAFVRERPPDPFSEARYCYYVTPKRDAKRVMTDERWVDDLVRRWDEVQETYQADEIARSYWMGRLRPNIYRPQLTFLVEGNVMVDAECLG